MRKPTVGEVTAYLSITALTCFALLFIVAVTQAFYNAWR